MLKTLKKRLNAFMAALIIGSFTIFFAGLTYEHEQVVADKKDCLQKQVEIAFGVVNYYQNAARRGILPEAQAKEMALSTLASMRYSEGGYFWVNNSSGILLVHPLPYMEHKNIIDFKDNKGKPYFQKIMDKVNSSDQYGFVEYIGPRTNSKSMEDFGPKLSYIKKVPEWGWTVGTGIQMVEITDDVTNMAKVYGFLYGVFLICGVFFVKAVLYPLAEALPEVEKCMDKIIEGRTEFECQHCNREDEVGDIARKVDMIREKIKTGTLKMASNNGNGFFDKDYFTRM